MGVMFAAVVSEDQGEVVRAIERWRTWPGMEVIGGDQRFGAVITHGDAQACALNEHHACVADISPSRVAGAVSQFNRSYAPSSASHLTWQRGAPRL